MNFVAGLDFSTHAIDLVKLAESSDSAYWQRIPLEPGYEGVRKIRDFPWARELEDVYLVALEDPMGTGKQSIKTLARIQGGILACIAQPLDVWLLTPAEWKKGIGMKGNVSTQKNPGRYDLMTWATHHGMPERKTWDPLGWPIDACAALAMAYTAREINRGVSARPAYQYRVVSANGAGIYGGWHRTLRGAQRIATRLADGERDHRVRLGPYEIERGLDLGSGCRYWMRQRERWILWNPHKDASMRQPDFIVGEPSP